MSEELLINQCSPTLAGLKTGNMFNCYFSNKEELHNDLRLLNKKLTPKGLRVIPLKIKNHEALIYVFRPSMLEADLSDKCATDILDRLGYPDSGTDIRISRLVKRLKSDDDFPHEIGLFLGYPPEDVYGFIENNAFGHKFSGCWKVYGNVSNAKKTFAKYKKCTDVYHSLWKNGFSIEKLTVAG